jgi:hypothetical protein
MVMDGHALSYPALLRALDLANEYAGFVDVQILIFSRPEAPTNVLKYLPVSDFRFAEDLSTAALVPLDLEDDEEDEEEDDDDEDDDIKIQRPITKKVKNVTLSLELF